jgi:hypothetical protein
VGRFIIQDIIDFVGWARRPKRRTTSFLTGTGKADLGAKRTDTGPVPPSRPAMKPPPHGGMSVAIQQTDGWVWVWVLVSETTKQTLSSVLNQSVDEYPANPERTEQSIREHLAGIDATFSSHGERQKYTSDFRRKMMTPTPIMLRDMLKNPFRYPATDAQKAVDYIDRLKTKVFPKIKGMIEAQSGPKTETFEL